MTEKYDSLWYRIAGPTMKDYGTMSPWWKKNEIGRPASVAVEIFLITIGLLILLAISIAPASAQTITVENPSGIADRDIMVYYPNISSGHMDELGRFNTTSVIQTDGNVSYIFSLASINTNPIDDPTEWVNTGLFPWIRSNAIVLLFGGIIVGYMFSQRR